MQSLDLSAASSNRLTLKTLVKHWGIMKQILIDHPENEYPDMHIFLVGCLEQNKLALDALSTEQRALLDWLNDDMKTRKNYHAISTPSMDADTAHGRSDDRWLASMHGRQGTVVDMADGYHLLNAHGARPFLWVGFTHLSYEDVRHVMFVHHLKNGYHVAVNEMALAALELINLTSRFAQPRKAS